jgi:hypothetical protein
MYSSQKSYKLNLAAIISFIFNPFHWFALLNIAAYLILRFPIRILLILLILQYFCPTLTMYLGKRFRVISDYDVTKRNERWYFISMLLIVSFLSALSSGNYLFLMILNVSFFISALVLGIVTMIFKWKMSGHMLFDALLFLAFTRLAFFTFPLLFTLPFIGKSRIKLMKHTTNQVIAGTLAVLVIYTVVYVYYYLIFAVTL